MKPSREKTVLAKGCRNPRCPRPQKIRGLCPSCYMAAYRLVSVDEVVSWEALEAAGKVSEQKRAAKTWLLEGVKNA